ncbi:DNA cytosine methyltransferase [Streptomyces sp. ISL-66]|uniref:DNA cytosine methyltransferase n=1 Tax=Streptomyces sp. ISL-66 TaxID=2819186 RepID=UPI001BE9FDA1|nr:DNA cytosine methyltransferase [Streptomyces sp. ISL-66]MBT2472939.1 DNA cytosine methyltransferase [Streptomyces sp. ISL-66]
MTQTTDIPREQQPRLLDAFCCQGGAGMGYHHAGFDVTGVDKDPQTRYPLGFHQSDAIDFIRAFGSGFDFIHASPPCQHDTDCQRIQGNAHPDLIAPTREALNATGRPWVIENVPEAAWDGTLRADYLLCGTQFGLNVRRRRAFETSWNGGGDLLPPCWHHKGLLAFEHKGERAYADAMGCTWMNKTEARQAVPPAYTEWIATQYLSHETEAAA